MSEPRDTVTITPYTDGPLIVRGAAQLIDEHGAPIERHRRTIALCRCGASAIKPWCDGTHKLSGFRTAPPPTDGSSLSATDG